MAELAGKVAIITGGASGIGEAATRLFVAEGAKVLIADIQKERSAALAEELGPDVLFTKVDVRQGEQVEAAVDLAVDTWGRLDCMFNNAGFGGVLGPIEDIPVDDFDMTMDVPFNWGDPVIGVHRTYISSNIKKGVIWSNTQNYSNSKVDDILKRAGVALDQGKRKSLYHETIMLNNHVYNTSIIS